MERITFWSGLETIGSNIFSVDDGHDRIVMDFGMPDEVVPEGLRTSRREYFIDNKKLPDIPFFYDSERTYQNEAVFISHLHIDHISGLKNLPANIKVYMSAESEILLDNLQRVGMEAGIEAEIIGVPFDEAVEIGHYKVTFIENDHDIPGSSSILVDTGKRRILHSGDLRKNGYHPDNISRVIKKSAPVDLLLIEGTEFSFMDDSEVPDEMQRNEINLLMDFKKEIEQKSGPLVINPYPRNIERLVQLNNMSLDLGVPVLWQHDTAALLSEYTGKYVYRIGEFSGKLPHTLHLDFDSLERIGSYDGGRYLHMNGVPLGDFDARFQYLQDVLEKNNFEYVDIGVSGHATAGDIIDIAGAFDPELVIPWHTFKPELQGEILSARGHKVFLPEKGISYELEDLL